MFSVLNVPRNPLLQSRGHFELMLLVPGFIHIRLVAVTGFDDAIED